MPAGIDDLATLSLLPVPGGAAAARRFAGDTLGRWQLTDLVPDVELVLSELVTNAVLHARTDIEVALSRVPEGVRIEVADGSNAGLVPHVLVPPPPPGILADDADFELVEELLFAESTTGRGLQLVESLSVAWGRAVRPDEPGKVVWAVVGHPSPAPPETPAGSPAAPAPQPAGPPPAVGHPVRLIAVPVWLALASEINLDALVREFQMIEAAGAPDDHPADLVELARKFLDEFASPRLTGQLALRAALRGGDRLLDADLLVPPAVIADLARMGQVLDGISAYCERGELLALAPSPEVRQFRQWYVEEVTRQVGGEEPRPCPFTSLATHDGDAIARLAADDRAELRRIEAALERAADVDDAVGFLLNEFIDTFGARHASLFALRAGRVEMLGSIGLSTKVLSDWSSFGVDDDVPAAEAIRGGQPVVVRTRRERDDRYPIFVDTPTLDDMAFVCVPLIGERQTCAGCLNVSFRTSRDVNPTQLQVLVELGSYMADALDRLSGAAPAT